MVMPFDIEHLHCRRKNLTSQQASLLAYTWNHFLQHGTWIPTRTAHRLLGKSSTVEAIDGLGGSIMLERSASGNDPSTYHLTSPGMLLADESGEALRLLARLLRLFRDTFLDDDNVQTLSGTEIVQSLHLASSEESLMRRIVAVDHLWTGGGSSGPHEWSVSLPSFVDDLPEAGDLEAFAITRAFEAYDPAIPAWDIERRQYSRVQASPNQSALPFIKHDELRSVLERDLEELTIAHEHRCWKSCLILAGGILEGVLFDALHQITGEEMSSDDLSVLAAEAGERGLLDTPASHLSQALRTYRNLIHPRRHLKELTVITADEGAVAYRALHACLRSVAQNLPRLTR